MLQLLCRPVCFRFCFSRPSVSLNACFRSLLRSRKFCSTPEALQSANNKGTKLVGWWFMGCGGLVFATLALGGVTRLTESGLSIVNWRLIRGMKPPINKEDWIKEFETYKQYPEYKYKTVDREMTLNEFKFIWIMEYSHRMIARMTGVFYLLPATVFWMKGYMSNRMKLPVVLGGGLLLFQGLLGWYMVKSGLDPTCNSNAAVPRVSQYRLAAHLSSAFALYGLLFWCGLSHLFPVAGITGAGVSRLRMLAGSTLGLTVATAVVGAFVAGLDAGLVYNSWPKFSDRWIPTDLWALEPKWKNLFDNPTNVQFFHRNLAYATVLVALATFIAGRRLPLSRRTRVVLDNVFYVSAFQVALGVVTLVHYVPVWLGSLHQINFMFLLSFVTMLLHELKRLPIK